MSMGNPSLAWLVAVLLLLAAAVSLFAARRQPSAGRLLHAALLLGTSGAFFLFLFPPSTTIFLDGQLMVLTPGVETQQLARHAHGEKVIALPGVDAPAQVPHWPDLASALRHHDAALHVVGAGLPTRDRDAAHGRVAQFDAAPLPQGIIELSAVQSLPAGRIWHVSGRSHGDVTRVELHDPGGAVVDQTTVDGHGDFGLTTALRVAGPALFSLRAFAADDALADVVPLGVDVQPGAAINMLVLAGAPDAELKYLRRWAVDGGLQFSARTALAGDIALHEGDDALDAARLAALDLLVVDERSWQALPPAQRQAINGAVRAGLGLLLRITGPLDEATQAEWQALGIGLQTQGSTPEINLDSAPGVSLQRQPWDLQRGAPLLRSAAGDALAAWQWHGQGRVGVTWLEGAWPLVLAGEGASFGSVWAGMTSTLARARDVAELFFSALPRVGERVLICGLTGLEPQILDAQGGSVTLLADDSGCAAFWPRHSGWHVFNINELARYIHVIEEGDAQPLRYSAAQLATQRMVDTGRGAMEQTVPRPLPRWPFFLGWVLLLGLLWWLERHRQQLHK